MDKQTLKTVAKVAVPIMITQGVTNFVNMLDNVMVGQLGTLSMSGVSIANQLLLIFNLAIIGTANAVGIFSAQYFGSQDEKGVRYCINLKFILTLLVTALAMVLFYNYGPQLISLFLENGANNAADIAATLDYGYEYLKIMLIGNVPFAIQTSLSNTVKESGDTVGPMNASLLAIAVNCFLNYVLIFGNFGAPQLGVRGAAIATVISRFAELLFMIFVCIRKKYFFIHKLLSHLIIPKNLIMNVLTKGTPLIANEILWSNGQALIIGCYSRRGLNAVAAVNISATLNNVCLIVCMALGISITILVGQRLGARDIEGAYKLDLDIVHMSAIFCVGVGIAMYVAAPYFPMLYNTTDEVRGLATSLLKVNAFFQPIGALYMTEYFTMRTGGKTFLTFCFDSLYLIVIGFPVAYFLVTYTTLPIVTVFACVLACDIPKTIVGYFLVRKGIWLNTLVE